MSKEINPTPKPSSLGLRKRSAMIQQTSTMASLANIEMPRLFNQLVIFVLDGSGSMTFNGSTGRPKGEEVESAVKMVIDRLIESKNKECFDIWIWAYADETVEILPATKVVKVNTNSNLNPCDYIEKYQMTKLNPVLEKVKQPVADYLKEKDKSGTPARAMLLVLSDGALHDLDEARKNANKLKLDKRVFLSAMFFESNGVDLEEQDEASTNLGSLASSEGLFIKTTDVEAIRDHMIHSISSTTSSTI